CQRESDQPAKNPALHRPVLSKKGLAGERIPGKSLFDTTHSPAHGAFFSPPGGVVLVVVFVSVFFVSPLPQPTRETANTATRSRDRIFFTSTVLSQVIVTHRCRRTPVIRRRAHEASYFRAAILQ